MEVNMFGTKEMASDGRRYGSQLWGYIYQLSSGFYAGAWELGLNQHIAVMTHISSVPA